MKAGVDAPEPALEQGGEGSRVASGSGVAGFFSAPVGRFAASHRPVDTAQNSANAMTRMRRSSRPVSLIWLSSQWIKRFLANARVVSDAVMAPYGREVLARLSAQGQTVVLLIDQTKVSERHQVVMVAVRLGGRALPLAWRVKETQGAIGFAEQRAALEAAAHLLPAGAQPGVMGGRVFGRPPPIARCRGEGWGGGPRGQKGRPRFWGGGGDPAGGGLRGR